MREWLRFGGGRDRTEPKWRCWWGLPLLICTKGEGEEAQESADRMTCSIHDISQALCFASLSMLEFRSDQKFMAACKVQSSPL